MRSRRPRAARPAAAAPLLALLAALLACGAAAAATAPSALTGPVSAVTGTSATVSGTINPNGTATTWTVDYGSSSSYGSMTTAQDAGSGTSSTGVSANLTGLSPGTTYHYRISATNSGGTTNGTDGLFTTLPAPGAITRGASNVTQSSVTLNGTVQPNGSATTWTFEYGKTTSYGTSTVSVSAGSGSGGSAVSANVTGLSPGTTYHYRLDAMSSAGTTQGTDATFTTAYLPPAVTTLSASGVGCDHRDAQRQRQPERRRDDV